LVSAVNGYYFTDAEIKANWTARGTVLVDGGVNEVTRTGPAGQARRSSAYYNGPTGTEDRGNERRRCYSLFREKVQPALKEEPAQA